MKRFIEGEDRTQITLLPESLDDYITEGNPVTTPINPEALKRIPPELRNKAFLCPRFTTLNVR